MCFTTEASTLPRKFNIFGFLSQPLNFASYGMRVFNKTWRGRENAPKMCSPNEFCGISQPSGKFSRRKLYENVESFFTSEMLYLLVSVHHSSVYLCHSLKWNKKKFKQKFHANLVCIDKKKFSFWRALKLSSNQLWETFLIEKIEERFYFNAFHFNLMEVEYW